jgi:hypothetical protein
VTRRLRPWLPLITALAGAADAWAIARGFGLGSRLAALPALAVFVAAWATLTHWLRRPARQPASTTSTPAYRLPGDRAVLAAGQEPHVTPEQRRAEIRHLNGLFRLEVRP